MLGSAIAEETTFGSPLHIVLTGTSLWRKPVDDKSNIERESTASQRLGTPGF